MLNIVVSAVAEAILLYECFAPSPFMLRVKPSAEVTTPFFNIMARPSKYSVIPGMVAVNAVEVEVESTLPNAMEVLAIVSFKLYPSLPTVSLLISAKILFLCYIYN